MAARKSRMGTTLSAIDAAAANLHDTDPLTNGNCRAIYVGGAGDLKVTMAGDTGAGGNAVTFSAVPAGTLLPISAKQVFNSGTTATLVIVLY